MEITGIQLKTHPFRVQLERSTIDCAAAVWNIFSSSISTVHCTGQCFFFFTVLSYNLSIRKGAKDKLGIM